jgi:hypothetical protein
LNALSVLQDALKFPLDGRAASWTPFVFQRHRTVNAKQKVHAFKGNEQQGINISYMAAKSYLCSSQNK